MGCFMFLPFAVLITAMSVYMTATVGLFTLFSSALFAAISMAMSLVMSIVTGFIVGFVMILLM
jgi:hypothetical protein